MILTLEDYQTILDLASAQLIETPEYNGTDLASLILKLQWIIEHQDED